MTIVWLQLITNEKKNKNGMDLRTKGSETKVSTFRPRETVTLQAPSSERFMYNDGQRIVLFVLWIGPWAMMNPEGNSKIGSLNAPRSASFNFRLPDAFSPHMNLFKEQLTMSFLNEIRKKRI